MTKKTLYFDSQKCVGCYACAVACMDQNDTDLLSGDLMFRHVLHVEGREAGEVCITHVSLACQHCEGAECLDACPSRALRRDPESGSVSVVTPARWRARSVCRVSVATARCRNAMVAMRARATATLPRALTSAQPVLLPIWM